jgi:DNA-binding NtrC family response regulator
VNIHSGELRPVAILVEDERQIRRIVRTALEPEGWLVHEAETLRQGLSAAGMRILTETAVGYRLVRHRAAP